MNPFEHTRTVVFELSNWCGHAWLHDKCPLHIEAIGPGMIQAPVTLPSSIVLDVLEELGDWEGELAFHQYNEPLQDPRLFWLLERAQMICPKTKPYICTIGANLTADLCMELQEVGVAKLIVSIYGDDKTVEVMRKRMVLLQTMFGDWLEAQEERNLDDRLLVYDVPKEDPLEPCYAPLRNVVITRDGLVGLCCFDWQRQHTFGDLRDKGLGEILASKEARRLYDELSTGRRELNLCRQCGRSR